MKEILFRQFVYDPMPSQCQEFVDHAGCVAYQRVGYVQIGIDVVLLLRDQEETGTGCRQLLVEPVLGTGGVLPPRSRDGA